MRVLITGGGKSGSWLIRGEQLGRAMGVDVVPNAGNCSGYDIVVLVKRPAEHTIQAAQHSGAKVVWDIVDAWPQPIGNLWDEFACMSWLDSQLKRLRPDAVVAPTEQMAKDLRKFSLPTLSLHHHARPNMRRVDIRPQIRNVGYEGSLRHLGIWEPRIRTMCSGIGANFVPNPDELAELDVVIAMRELHGYAPRNWKSNVKLANAQSVGLPIICNREAGYLETAGEGVLWADQPTELQTAIKYLADPQCRKLFSEQLIKSTITLESVASKYKAWLRSLI